ncbi:acyltransferase family protein [Micromonospora sp. DT47]|uniref:acyltransferase family protein n=1 Tax=Micromonospora sp. DT47 TaxID=3393431 RepID=UPI003CEF4F3A
MATTATWDRHHVSARHSDAAAVPAPHLGFRADIEGLRAVAVTLVVLAHAGIATLAGGYVGVDVFFVISGFLITTLLVKELSRTGTVSLAGFYARRAARLLPASTVVLVATLVASWLWLPPTRFRSVSLDALFSTFYGINWRLAAVGTDYFNDATAPSPLQHLWSLAVEEQFYLVWPLLLLATWAWRRGRSNHRLPIVMVLGGIVVASLLISVWQSEAAAPWAYFGAHTRAHELAVGALVAVSAGALTKLPKPLAAVLTWVGLAAVLTAALTFNENTTFPGYAALLPVLGTAAVIAGGTATGGKGAARLLGTWPFQQIGKLSYGWYLWHWPVLMIGPSALGVEPTVKVNLALAAGALALTVVSYHLVENPIRNRSWLKARARRGVSLGLVLSGAAAVLALVASTLTPPLPVGPPAVDTIAAVASAPDPEAALSKLIAEAVRQRDLPGNLTPSVAVANGDVPRVYPDNCSLTYTELRHKNPCTYGDVQGKEAIYLIGDSHGAHWYPAFDAIARDRGMRFVSLTKSGCQVPSVTVIFKALKRPYNECDTWRKWVIEKIRRDRPAMVVMSSNGGDGGGLVDASGRQIPTKGHADDALWVAGWRSTINQIKAPGTKLVLISDTPWPYRSAPDCAALHPRDLPVCGRPASEALYEPARRQEVATMAQSLGVTVIDPMPWFCTRTTCPIVVGNVLVYKDFSHISTFYARALVPLLDAKLP